MGGTAGKAIRAADAADADDIARAPLGLRQAWSKIADVGDRWCVLVADDIADDELDTIREVKAYASIEF